MRQTPERLIERATQVFGQRFGQPPAACGVGPGRVEILGNHTDYNGGGVLTAAIDRYLVVAGRRNDTRSVRVHALDLDASAEFGLDNPAPRRDPDWSSYVLSVFAVLARAGVAACGMDLVVTGDVPRGAGLGSSAALETAVAMLILQLCPHEIERLELARLLQRGEHEFAGVRCGLLDQFSSLHGEEDRLIFLDCATGAHETLGWGSCPPALVLCDSGVSRRLGGDAPYNRRRAECEQAAALLARRLGRNVPVLCAVSLAELEQVAAEIPQPMLSRARHVIGEHERVLAARDLLRAGRIDRLGDLLVASHESSRALFENSCAELDRLCAAAAGQPGYWGGRLCGAGWGGCTLTLVDADRVAEFVAGMTAATDPGRRTDDAVHVCYASGGAFGRRL